MPVPDLLTRARAGRGRAAALLGLLLVAALLAACGGGGDDDAVAAAADPAPATESTVSGSDETSGPEASDPETSDDPASDLSPDDQQLAFAQCLRDQGVDVADPSPGQVGLPGLDRSDSETQAAIETCREEVGDVTFGQVGENMAEPDALLDFVDCMREQGIDMPDPGPDGQLSLPENVDPDDPSMRAAGQECSELLRGGGILVGGGGPGEGGGVVSREQGE